MENAQERSVTTDSSVESAPDSSVESVSDRTFYDAIDLNDCAAVKCTHLERTGGSSPTISCTVAAVDICPAVMANNQPKTDISLNSAKEYVGEIKEKVDSSGSLSSPGLQEYEVWCRETCEDTAIILAKNLIEAHDEAGHMVATGQLYPAGSVDVLFGVRDVSAGEANTTLICDHMGEISVVYSKGDLAASRIELKTAGYDVIAAFIGHHEDISER